MNANCIIVFPDYLGKACGGDFAKSLLKMYPGIEVVAMVNGGTKYEMQEAAQTALPGIIPFITLSKGVVASLLKSYEHIIANYPDDQSVVRLDTAEHPIEYVAALAAKAEEIGGMTIGDLDFAAGGLVPGSLDEAIHLIVFPEMYNYFSGGHFSISCAHGFQAYGGKVFETIVNGAWKIVQEAERKLGTFPQWGLDGAMALSAAMQNIPVEVIPVPAMSKRNRPTPKVFQQWEANYNICLAAEKVFNDT
ncbi:MAG: hypothetical protein PHW50_02510 [Patescibacteria group bacterium]|nr:hypothetical protein [Patescibacteria group bacterium]